MARHPSKSVYNLIKVLSKTERRYISLFIGTHFVGKNNKYVKLYELIQNQQEIDDREIKKLLYPDREVSSSTFATVKNKLFQIILRTLIAYDENNSVELNIYTELQKIKVLYKRGLIKECKELILRLSEKAEGLGNPKIILELNSWRKKLDSVSMDVVSLEKHNSLINRTSLGALEVLSSELNLEIAYYDLFVQRMQKATKTDLEDKTRLYRNIKSLLNSSPETSTYNEKKWRLKILNYYYLITNDFENFHTASTELYQLVKSNQRDFNENPGDMIPVIGSIVRSCSQLKKWDDMEKYLPEFLELAALKTIGLPDKVRAVCSYHLNLILIEFEKGELDKSTAYIENFLASYKEEFYKLYLLNFSIGIASVYFANRDFEKALIWTQKINNNNSTLRQDLSMVSRCISMIIHYELDNTLLLHSLMRSAKRYMKKSFEDSPLEVLLIRMLRKLIEVPFDKKEKIKHIEQFYNEITELPNKNLEAKNFNRVLLSAWCQSKIQNKSMSDILKERINAD